MRPKTLLLYALSIAASPTVTSAQLTAGTQQELKASLNCVRDGIDEPVRWRIGIAVLAESRGESGPSTGDIAQMATVAQTCRQKFGWTEKQLENAIVVTTARLAIDPAVKALQEAGVDSVAIANAFFDLPDGTRASFAANPIPDASVEALLAQLAQRDVVIDEEAKGELIGLLAGLLATGESSLSRFIGG